MAHNLISAIDMAVELVRNSPEPGSATLFNQVEPLFFELTRRHSAYIRTFDDVIVLMQMSEASVENTYADIQAIKTSLEPVRIKVNVLTEALKQAFQPGKTNSKDPLADFLRKINWYFHIGAGGISKFRLKVSSYTSLYDILSDWKAGFTDYALLSETRTLRGSLIKHWSSLCTSYTRVKLLYLKDQLSGPPKD